MAATLRLGGFSEVALAGLAALAIWIARLNHPDQNQYDIFFKQSVDGVAKGSVVSFSEQNLSVHF